MARRSKLTEELTERVSELVSAGNYIAQACAACGIGERTFYRWMQEGEAVDGKVTEFEAKVDAWNDLSYAERRNARERRPTDAEVPTEAELAKRQFWQSLKRAEATAEARHVAIISKAAQTHWQAAAWYLERKHHTRWGRKDRVQMDAQVQTIETKKVSDTQAELADLLGEDAV